MRSEYVIKLALMVWVIGSCARMSSPEGGPKDTTPPTVVSYSVENLSKQVPIDTEEIKIHFDEYIKLKDQQQQIIVSPPMEKAVDFYPKGSTRKYITIHFSDSLQQDMTYTINFGSSIEDYNENNPLSGFQYVFSTGATIDSLLFSGKISDVQSQDYDKDVVVTLYKADETYTDSTVFKQKPYYITRPDSTGNFQFNHLAQGKYALVGLGDRNRNLKYDPVVDKIAFIDTVVNLPADEKAMELKLFTEQEKFALKKADLLAWGKILFVLTGSPHGISVENRDERYTQAKLLPTTSLDSLHYWYKPLDIDTLKESRKDTLGFIVKQQGVPIDTLSLNKKVNLRPEKLKIEGLKSSEALGSKTEFIAQTPITNIIPEKIRVLDKDSTLVNFQVEKDTTTYQSFSINFEKQYDQHYTILLEPKAVVDLFDQTNDSIAYEVMVLPEIEYANLEVVLNPSPQHPFWLQVLDKDNRVVREQYTTESNLHFRAMLPNTYHLKMIADLNANKWWDTGDYLHRKQAEPIFFYKKEIVLNAYWNVKTTWDWKP